MNDSGRSPGALTIGAFAVTVLIGSGNFIAVRFSNRDLPPFWGAGLRFALAALIFVVIALALRLTWPRGRELGLTVWYGVLSFPVSYGLFYWALLDVTAGVATVVMATVPLLTLLLAAVHGLERLHRRGVIGSVVALGGIGWMAVGPQPIVLPLAALIAMLVSALAVGESIILGKKISGSHPVMINAVAMSAGAALLLALSAVAGESWSLPQLTESIWAVVYMVTLGSVGLFVLILLIYRRWTASATSYVFVLFPVLTMVLGSWLGDGPVTLQGVTGALIVVFGVWFGALSPAARRLAGPLPAQGPPPPEPTGPDAGTDDTVKLR
jgi:drug/metabolite transporter (DMT)-like permease